MADKIPNSHSKGSHVTKTAALVAGGYVLYHIWAKWMTPRPSVSIDFINVYPVKSCRGLQEDSWPLSKYGLQHDREWMIYNPKTMRFVCQRQVHALCRDRLETVDIIYQKLQFHALKWKQIDHGQITVVHSCTGARLPFGETMRQYPNIRYWNGAVVVLCAVLVSVFSSSRQSLQKSFHANAKLSFTTCFEYETLSLLDPPSKSV